MNKLNFLLRKNQVVLISFLMYFVTLIVVSILLNPIVQFIDLGINATNSTIHGDLVATLLNYIPLFIVIVLLISLFQIISNR